MTLPYHTLTPTTCNFAHAPALLGSTPLFRSEALPYYLTRLHVDLDQEEARYRNYLKKRPADDCSESTYEAWVKSLVMLEEHIRALRREIEMMWCEVHVPEVLTKVSLVLRCLLAFAALIMCLNSHFSKLWPI